MKLNKMQINAMVDKIYREITTAIKAINQETEDTTTATFLKTEVGKAIVKVNNSFFNNPPIPEYQIPRLALQYYDIKPSVFPSKNAIENDVVLGTIESDNLDDVIELIKNKYVNVQ